MNEKDWLAARFEDHRQHLRSVAYRMLGSLAEADEAVQDAWVRVSQADATEVENLGGWLTTIVGRVCLNLLRSRNARREDAVGVHVPDPVIAREERGETMDAERETILADSVALALLVVLDTLEPAERLAFVLHDMFDLPFEEIAPMLGRTPAAARQLASRARRRVQGAAVPSPDADVSRQRAVVNAYFTAARGGDFEGLVAILHPDVVLRSDGGTARPQASALVRGASAVASRAMKSAQPTAILRPVMVNGAAGVVVMVGDTPVSVIGFTVVAGKIVAIDAVADPDRVRAFDFTVLEA